MFAKSAGHLELMVLFATMHVGDDAYGVTIADAITASSGREVLLGSIYAALARLEEKGFVRSELGEPTAARGGRAKRFFRVTRAGVREARQARRTFELLWTPHSPIVSEI